MDFSVVSDGIENLNSEYKTSNAETFTYSDVGACEARKNSEVEANEEQCSVDIKTITPEG
jgi:hypothetical protein